MSIPESGPEAVRLGTRGPDVLVEILKAGVVADGSGIAWPKGAPVYLRERDAVDAALAGAVEIAAGGLSPQGLDYLAGEGVRPYTVAGPKNRSGPTILIVAKRDGAMCSNRVMAKGEVVEVPEEVAYAILRWHEFESPDLDLAAGSRFTLSTSRLEAAWKNPLLDISNVF